MAKITLEWVMELIRLNRGKEELDSKLWADICNKVGMNNMQVKYVLIKLLLSMSAEFIESEERVEKLEAQVVDLQSDIKTLRDNPITRNYELAKSRLSNGKKIARKHNASKEIILSLKEKGFTYKKIAETLNVGRSTIWRHLNN